MFREIIGDFHAIRDRDPAARGGPFGWIERATCYSGFHALLLHRVAHALHHAGLHLIARLLSQFSRLVTGIEIHPAAAIGRRVFIDHGMGVVIGETAVVGDNVTLFQGVTLGGTGKESGKRHPTIEAGVTVGTGAKVLGGITVGAGSKIGAGSVVVEDVPPNATVVGVPGRIVMQEGMKRAGARLDHGNLPDPIREALENLAGKIEQYERLLATHGISPGGETDRAAPAPAATRGKADASGGAGGEPAPAGTGGDILAEIAEHKRVEVSLLKDHRPLARVKASFDPDMRPRPFGKALRGERLRLIAEIKHASPSAGVIREPFEPLSIARAYAEGGAAAISVLTDAHYFQGSLADLRDVRKALDLPVLRKDFMLDPYQLHESRAAGADAILLIVKMLEPAQFRELFACARELEMDALVEVHDADELDIALGAGASIVGINNRDLSTFQVRLETTLDLAGRIPDGVTIVSESGIRTREDLDRLEAAGVHAALVGEALMRQDDIEAAVRELLGPADREEVQGSKFQVQSEDAGSANLEP